MAAWRHVVGYRYLTWAPGRPGVPLYQEVRNFAIMYTMMVYGVKEAQHPPSPPPKVPELLDVAGTDCDRKTFPGIDRSVPAAYQARAVDGSELEARDDRVLLGEL